MSEPFGSEEVEPLVGFLWSYDLAERVALSGNVNLASPAEDNDRFLESSASGSISAALTERLGAYVEYFGLYPSGGGPGPRHFLNGGLTFLVTDNLQLDIRVGFGLNDRAEDVFTGAGFAVRF